MSHTIAELHANADEIESTTTNVANIAHVKERDVIVTTCQEFIDNIVLITEDHVMSMKLQLEYITSFARDDFTAKVTVTGTNLRTEVEAIINVMKTLEYRQKIL